jgi:hypothetical protein
MSIQADRWWLTGLADGESYFRFNAQNKGSSWAFYWGIKLRADDSKVLLRAQRILGGVGRMYEVNSPSLRMRRAWGRQNAKPAVSLQVYRREDVMRVIEHFDRYPLQSKKAGDFVIWREAVLLWFDATYATGGYRIGRQGRERVRPKWVFDCVADLALAIKEQRGYV